MHRTLVLAFLAGGSIVGCLGSAGVDEELSEEMSESLESSVCGGAQEGGQASLSCPAGHVISAVEFASYGSRQSGTCGSFRVGSCNAPTSKSVVEAACLGKQSCTVAANNATFGDPCRRSRKQLRVQVACAPESPDGGAGAGGGGAGGDGGGGDGAGGSDGGGGEVCGNGTCGAGEDCSSCSSDCGACSTCAGAGPDTTPLDAEEQAFLGIINQYRAQNGLGALSACTSLSRAAQGHSEDMRDRDYFAHDSQDGRTPWVRATNACYVSGASAENIAAGNSGAQATFDQWKNSPGHNTNMLGSGHKVIGIGRATGGGTYRTYWTTVFGRTSEASCN
ncbi:CAP domain-containing protein [Sorangium cellulosum]|uniref:CAP domain-containing protein n=1 Tax=Sorangium cellulosum TaxID=56 RepID=UPI001331567A|nr:CAP domain-containing protein [Sorangium cellulosum]